VTGSQDALTVTLDGEAAGHLIRLGEDRSGSGREMRQHHDIYAHAGCGGRVQHGRSGTRCARCLQGVPEEEELHLGLVLKEGFPG